MRKQDRVVALIMAGMFLLTVLATGGLVVWQIREENKLRTVSESGQTDNSPSTLDQANNQENQNMLQGTTLENFTPITSTDGLQKIDLVEGTGEVVEPGATITAHYTGAYAVNGEIFESSKDSGQPATFPLGNVIQGWQQGVPGMKVGGKRRLIIPGELAYGQAPEGYTPGSGSRPLGILVFDIELVSIGE